MCVGRGGSSRGCAIQLIAQHLPVPIRISRNAPMAQAFVVVLGSSTPANRIGRYVDTATGFMQRRAAGVFTPQDGEQMSPRTACGVAARTYITFEPLR